jgi:delta 1-pyrroline-5-carboxylate dehydrogenase
VSNVTLSMKMSPKAAGALFSKACRLEDENSRLQARVAELEEFAANMFNAITMDNHALNEAAQTEADTALFNSTEDYAIWCEDQPSDSRAWLLRQKADAVEEAREHMLRDAGRGCGMDVDEANAWLKVKVQHLKDAADKAGGAL